MSQKSVHFAPIVIPVAGRKVKQDIYFYCHIAKHSVTLKSL